MAAFVPGMLMQPISQHAWAGLRLSMTKDRSVLTMRRRTSSSGLIIGRRGNFPGFDRNRAPANVVLANTRSEEHTSELQSLMRISYAVFCWTHQLDNYIATHRCGTKQ